MIDNKRIGIFQLEWELQVQTLHLITMLAKEGYTVDVFLHKNQIVADFDYLKSDYQDVHFHIFDPIYYSFFNVPGKSHHCGQRIINFSKKIYRILKQSVSEGLFERLLYLLNSDRNLVKADLINQTTALMAGKTYVCFIGIEKMGLLWSGKLAGTMKVPNIYYSLELYTHNHPFVQRSNRKKRVKIFEEYYHKQCRATIVQDEMRGRILYEDNHVDMSMVEPIYLPVSSLGECVRIKTNTIEQMFNLKHSDILILYYGWMAAGRKIDELIRITKEFPGGWKLILHGIDAMNVHKFIRENNGSNQVLVSTKFLSHEGLMNLISSATVGMVLYDDSNLNNILTVFSSEKICMYLKCGIPIIAFRYPGYDIFENYRCGVLIQSMSEIPSAIRKILENYSSYRENAYRCFEENYEYSKNFSGLKKYLDTLSDERMATH